MRIIQGKHIQDAPQFVMKKLSPALPVPPEFQIRDYGVDTLEAGVRIDRHYHDCDEWWVIAEGRAHIEVGAESAEAGAGAMIFTPAGEEHILKPLTNMKLIWFEGPLKGKKQPGHLHSDPVEEKYFNSLIK